MVGRKDGIVVRTVIPGSHLDGLNFFRTRLWRIGEQRWLEYVDGVLDGEEDRRLSDTNNVYMSMWRLPVSAGVEHSFRWGGGYEFTVDMAVGTSISFPKVQNLA